MKLGNSIFKTFFLSLCIVANTSFVYAQTASILPPAKTTFNDQNGKPLTSGTVDFYVPNTTTRKTTWQDSGETIPNTNPVSLDAAGRALILGDGSYRQVVKDRYGNLVWDQVTSSLGGGGSSGTTIGDGLSVGTILPTSAIIAPVNYQFAYGQALSRASFPELLAALTYKSIVTCVGGSPVVTGLTDTTSISVGSVLESPCAAGSPSVISKTSTTVTLNTNSTVTITILGTFFIYGNGDALTTFNLPDLRGNTIAGRCNMGGVDCSNLNSTYFSSNSSNTPSALNAKGGAQNKTLLTANLPAYTPSGSVANGAITSSVTGGTLGGSAFITTAQGSGGGANVPTNAIAITVTSSQAASSFTGTAQGGTSTAFSIVQPTLTLNYVIKVSPDVNLSPIYGVASVGGMTGIITCGAGLTCVGNSIAVGAAGGIVNSLGGLTGNIGVTNGIAVSGSNLQTAFTQTGTGAVTQTITNKLSKDCVSPWDFTSATIDDGVTNAQPAIQLALNTGKCVYLPKPATCYLVNTDLTMCAGQEIYGDGRGVVTICAKTNGFTLGLFVCNNAQPGNTFRDMGVIYTQPDPTPGTVTAMRAQLTQYLPTFACSGAARVSIRHMLVENAWNGGNFVANAGGLEVIDLQLSAYGYGISMDGSLDTNRITDFHFWPFGLTANQTLVFMGTTGGATPGVNFPVGILAGRIDGLYISGYLSIAWLGLYTFHGVRTSLVGDCICYVSNSDFDSWNGVTHTAGFLQITNTLFSHAAGVSVSALSLSGTGTRASISNSYVSNSSNTSSIIMQSCTTCSLELSNIIFQEGGQAPNTIGVAASAVDSTLILNNYYVDFVAAGQSFLAAIAPSSGANNIHMSNGVFHTTAGTAYSSPIFSVAAGNRVTLTGNRANDKGAGAGTFINKAGNDFDFIWGNSAPGWTYTLPAAIGTYSPNN